MNCCFASFNTKGFQSSIESGVLPEPDHITYEGAFNELTFNIGKKATKSMELHIGFARIQNLNSSFDSQIHDYLAIFTKGNKDGEDRDHRILNSVVCLDISGSMGSGLTRAGEGCRMILAKEAIKMFFSKLRPTDSFGLVVFNHKGRTLIPCRQRSELIPNDVFNIIDSIQQGGGTTLSTGFDESKKILLEYFESKNYSKKNSYENRIIMLTDVGDNSMENAKEFIEKVAHSEKIHTTIIGISDDFISSTCESLNEIEGFNYFCATQVDDLKKYLFENFSFTFFPSNYDIEISLIENKNIKSIEVFGTVDAKKVKTYNDYFKKIQKNIIITKTKTSFPSQIKLTKDGVLQQFGGLVVVKLNLQSPNGNLFETKVRLAYKNSNGQKQEEVYPVSFEVPGKEQFYSDQCLAEAMPAFFYVYEIRNILEERSKNSSKNESKEYIQSLEKLKSICPKSKLKELQNMIKILNDEVKNQNDPNVKNPFW